MIVSKIIKKEIEKVPKGQPFSNLNLLKFGKYSNIRKILSRLEQSNEIVRLTQGLYFKPQVSKYSGITYPSPLEIIETISKNTGEIIGISGAQAVQELGLSTQMPMSIIFYTTGYTRVIKLGALKIQLKHVTQKKIVKPGTIVGMVISALYYLGKKNITVNTIETLHKRLNQKEFKDVLNNLNLMPGWMVECFTEFTKNLEYEN